jgi:hypothetical protein
MTAEGYDYEYGHSMFVFDDAYYGTRSSTTTTYHTEVTVDPPPWTCKSCRGDKHGSTTHDAGASCHGDKHGSTAHDAGASCHKIKGSPTV